MLPKSTVLKNLYLERDFSFIILIASLFLLPLSINLSTFGLILSLVLKIVQTIFLNHKLYTQKILKTSSYTGVFFFIYIILNSIIQTNIQYTLDVFEKDFSQLMLLCLAPILIRKREGNKLLIYGLSSGLIIACLYVFIMSLVLKIDFDKFAFLKLLNIHHTYLSIYILFFVNILLVSISNKFAFDRATIISALVLVVSFVILFVLGSKVSMIIYLVFVGIYGVKFFLKKKKLYVFFIIPILTVCFLSFNKNIDTSYKAALNFRSEIWREAVNSIQENPIFGNLKMNEKDILNLKHYISGKYYLMDSDLNSHNQYLSVLLRYGAIGGIILLPFIMMMIKHIILFKERTLELLGFSIIIFFICYFENVLNRHHGIVFFTVFFNYYLVSAENEIA